MSTAKILACPLSAYPFLTTLSLHAAIDPSDADSVVTELLSALSHQKSLIAIDLSRNAITNISRFLSYSVRFFEIKYLIFPYLAIFLRSIKIFKF